MSTTTFEDAKISDKVYSVAFGWGEIICTDGFEHYPIGVRFQNVVIDTHYFTLDGCYYTDNPIQSLFWDEVHIKAPVKPIKLPATKIVNGIEIPDISFKPSLNEYYYTPMPNYPELCHLMMDFHSNRLTNHLSVNNLCYPYTEEGRAAAILHAKAMLGIT
jgi:hypothetical protein